MITRWLGPPDEGDPGIESFRFTLEPDDTLLCCTDGLYMYFSPPVAEEDEMARILAEADSLQAAVDQMVDLAYKRGGHDNITLAAIQGQAADGAKRKRRVREKAETTLRLKRPDAVEEST
jgi:serine/threonine protein phosphatase PrpC